LVLPGSDIDFLILSNQSQLKVLNKVYDYLIENNVSKNIEYIKNAKVFKK
jgi:hypothetical protein